MEIYEKVRKYLYENVGHLTTPGTPRFDLGSQIWKVSVLCKTEKGILVVGEFHLDKDGDFTNIPTKEEMLKVVEKETENIPFLFYGNKEELKKREIEAVTI
ncbi:MAG: hypothetical protein V2A53_07765 [bacterium]